MAAAEDQDDPTTSQASSPPYAPAIIRVAVAQICLKAGYRRAEAAALRSLTDIATRYIRLLAGSAASSANSRGRTQSNILDLALALDFAAAGRGYAGATDFRRPLLRSPVLRELRAFVEAVDETPFPLPIQRRVVTEWKTTPSFAQAGKEPPIPHVPKWLPCFPPEGWERMPENSPKTIAVETSWQAPPAVTAAAMVRHVGRERERVRFKLRVRGRKNKEENMKKRLKAEICG